MGELAWLLRALLVILLVQAVLRFVFRRPTRPSRPQPRREAERAGGTLVRDPQCGTYIPIARAVRVGSGEAAMYFCSDACRAAWTAAHGQ